MPTATLSGKNQLTLPIDIVRTLGLKPGDKLIVQLVDDQVVLLPKPEDWAQYFMGSTKGLYGTKEEIDEYIAESRGGGEREEWREEFWDMVATDENVSEVVESLGSFTPHFKASSNQILKRSHKRGNGIDPRDMREAFDRLVKHGGVRRIPMDGSTSEVYRLVHEFAKP